MAIKHRNRPSSGPIGHLRKVEKDATGLPVQSRSEKEDKKEGRFERLENTINELIKEIKAQSRRQRRVVRQLTDVIKPRMIYMLDLNCKNKVKEGGKKKEQQRQTPRRAETEKLQPGNGQWSG